MIYQTYTKNLKFEYKYDKCVNNTQVSTIIKLKKKKSKQFLWTFKFQILVCKTDLNIIFYIDQPIIIIIK